MGADDKNLEPGGGGPKDLGVILQGRRAGGVDFWGRYVGPAPPLA